MHRDFNVAVSALTLGFIVGYRVCAHFSAKRLKQQRALWRGSVTWEKIARYWEWKYHNIIARCQKLGDQYSAHSHD